MRALSCIARFGRGPGRSMSCIFVIPTPVHSLLLILKITSRNVLQRRLRFVIYNIIWLQVHIQIVMVSLQSLASNMRYIPFLHKLPQHDITLLDRWLEFPGVECTVAGSLQEHWGETDAEFTSTGRPKNCPPLFISSRSVETQSLFHNLLGCRFVLFYLYSVNFQCR